jgi:hypothetical protein
MATWTNLGDNMELYWAVLSQQKPWAAKHKTLIFLLDRFPLCQFSFSLLELDEE